MQVFVAWPRGWLPAPDLWPGQPAALLNGWHFRLVVASLLNTSQARPARVQASQRRHHHRAGPTRAEPPVTQRGMAEQTLGQLDAGLRRHRFACRA